MIELNVTAQTTDGQPINGAIVTLYVLDKNLHECPMEPRIRNQSNFYAASVPYGIATGSPGPFQVYASVMANGYNPAYVAPTPWDGLATLDIPVTLVSFKKPFQPAPRYWNGVNMCGDHYDNLPPVAGGAADPTLFLSWFYDRYDAANRQRFRDFNKQKGRQQWLVSWPDSRAVGATPQSFAAMCRELIAAGFFPAVMLCSKDYDRDPNNKGYLSDENARQIIADVVAVLPFFVGIVPIFCEGWELADWWQPWQLQWLIDAVAPLVLAQAGTRNYVHLGAGKGSWQMPGQFFADFWNANIGKLHGLLHEKIPSQTRNQYQFDSGGLEDILIRYAGGAGCSPQNGFGTPFDLIALEITAAQQFEVVPPLTAPMTTAEGDTWGDTAINCPPVTGPFGPVGVIGSGNGYT